MEKKSFVFHFEYLADIPEELRPVWAMFIINYAENGVEPALNDWRDIKSWNAIKNRIDSETANYLKKVANLNQNNRKNLHSLENRLSGADNVLSSPEKTLSDTDNNLSDTEKDLSSPDNQFSGADNNSSDTENDLSGGVYVFDNVYVSVSDIDNVIDSDSDQKNNNKKNIKNNKSVEIPTLQDVEAYVKEKQYTFSPLAFWNYYNERQWTIGTGKKSYIINWRSACVTWNENDKRFYKNKNKAVVSSEENVEEYKNYFLGGENGSNTSNVGF